MRIALGQLNMVWEDKELSLQKAEKLMEQASAQKADILFFPEMSFTGFSMNLAKIGESGEASDTVRQMKELAVRLLDKDGQELTEYVKLHPFWYGGEADVYQGGDQLVTVPFCGHRISLFVCYDLRFPEIFQAVSDQSDLMVVIADWPASRADHWLALLKARAIENQSYMAGVNCVGDIDGLSYSGDSSIFDPLGQMIGTLHGQEGIVVCDIGEDAERLRQKFQMKCDRRNDFYIQQYEKIRKVQSL